MTNDKVSVTLTRDEFSVVEAALRTQEKILSVQSKANGGADVRDRLATLQRILRTLEGQSAIPPQSQTPGWTDVARSIFG